MNKSAKISQVIYVNLLFLAVFFFGNFDVKANPGDLDPTFDGDGKWLQWNQIYTGREVQTANEKLLITPNKIIIQSATNWFATSETYNYLGFDSNIPFHFWFNNNFRWFFDSNTEPNCSWKPFDAVRDGNGNIYSTGSWCFQNNPGTLLTRFKERDPAVQNDINLDTAFGGNGVQLVQFSDVANQAEYGKSILIQPDGKIVVGAVVFRLTPVFQGYQFAVARFSLITSNSAILDTTFNGGAGVQFIDFGTSFAVNDFLTSMAFQGNKIVVAGKTEKNCPDCSDMAVARLNSNGSLDTTFDGDGKKVMHFGANETILDLVTTSDKIILSGVYVSPTVGQVGKIIQLANNGSIDWSPDVANMGEATAIAKQSDGKYVVGGWMDSGGDSLIDFCIVRYNPNGTLDTTWGTNGYVTTDFADLDDFITDIGIQPDGKIVAVGRNPYNSTRNTLSIARYFPLAPTAATVSISGRITDNGGNGISRVRVSLTKPNGEILTATTNAFGYYTFENLEAGQTYVMQANSKRYEFQNNPRVLSVNENLEDEDFTVIENAETLTKFK